MHCFQKPSIRSGPAASAWAARCGFECLAEALDNRIEWGVWGGMTERERRLLLRQRTDVRSWRSVLVGQQGADAAK